MAEIKYEPVREHWVPYEPWMRDVLADDARVSWVDADPDEDPLECRATPAFFASTGIEYYADSLRIHPDDVPERPAEHDPDEALVDEMVDVIFGDGALSHEGLIEARRQIAENAIRVTREHVAATDWHGIRSRDRRAEEAEAERDEWEASFHRAEDEVGTLAVEVGNWKHVANVRGKREVWLSEERNHWKARHEALRADVERLSNSWEDFDEPAPWRSLSYFAALNRCAYEARALLNPPTEGGESDADA